MVHKFTAIRWILTLYVLCSIWLVCSAQTTYYVAANGNDANDGRSIQKPLLTLNKVSKLTLQAGDAVLFRRGDTFQGSLQIRLSGTAAKPIRYDAYGTGKKPLITGSVPVVNWTDLGNHRWQAPCPDCGDRLTGLYANGIAQPLGRYPNADAPNRGSLTVKSHVEGGQLSTQENLTTDWTGAEVVLFPGYWVIDRAPIWKQKGNTLFLNNLSSYPISDGWPCYIQNHPATLDQPGEWSYNAKDKTIQFYSDQVSPIQQRVTATSVDRGIDIVGASFITIQNLHVTQARASNLYASNVSNLTLINDDFSEAGEDGVTIQGTGHTILIDSSSITNCNNNGFFIDAYQDFIFRNSTIRRIGVVPGRGKGGDGQFIGFQSRAIQHSLIENNIIDSIGYIALTVANNSIIRKNLIADFCLVKSDGGGIYLFNGNLAPLRDIRIESNIIQRGIGTYGDLSGKTLSQAHGIFLDDCVDNVDVLDNTVFDCNGFGILMHAVSHVNILRNTCYNNSLGQLMLYNYRAPCLPRNNTLNENVLLAKTAVQSTVNYVSANNDLAEFGQMNRNYYARPFKDLSTIKAVYNYNVVDSLDLQQWQAQYRKDLTSRQSPITYKAYALKSMNTVSYLKNTFDKTTEGWDTWSPNGNGQLTWTTSPLLDGGGLQFRIPNVSNQPDSYALLFKNIPAVTKAQTYLLRFDAVSPVYKKMVVYIRQRVGSYQDLTTRYEFSTGPTRRSYEAALTVSADEADPLLSFQFRDESQPVLFDNIRLQEATVESVDPDNCIKLVYNPTQRDSVVVLDKPYRDVKNHYYARQVTLKPFTSVVLLRDTLPPVDVRLSLRATQTALKVNDTTTVLLTLHSESAKPTVSSRVKWTCRLPPNLRFVSGNGLFYTDSMLTGIVQQLRTDTTFSFRVKSTIAGSYGVTAEVAEATFADPTSTPNSGTEDGEDDTARLTLLVRKRTTGDSTSTNPPTAGIVTATQDPSAGSVVIYPNPASDEFTLTAGADIAVIRIVDLLGRERLTLESVHRGKIIRFGKELPSAYYILYVDYKGGNRQVVKLLKR